MKHKRLGFTLVEITLFLALTGLLFIGVAVGASSSIRGQRFQDSVQNFAEFLRSAYSQVENPQGADNKSGKSEQRAIYGKLLVFGDGCGLDDEANTTAHDTCKNIKDSSTIYSYTVLGDVSGAGSGKLLDLLKSLKVTPIAANYKYEKKSGVLTSTIESLSPAGMAESYIPRWGASIEKKGSDNNFTGSILIVRHPRTGVIYTFVSDEIIRVNWSVAEANKKSPVTETDYDKYGNILYSKLSTFTQKTVDFCLDPNGLGNNNENRRNIRILKNAQNTSGVVIIDMDEDDNGDSSVDDDERGNVCREL